MSEMEYCHACYKRIGQRVRPCSFCGRSDRDEPKQPMDAPSAGLVPVQVLFPKDVYETIKARTMALSAQGEQSHGFSEFVSAAMRRSLAG
jgi:hypothetical protein